MDQPNRKNELNNGFNLWKCLSEYVQQQTATTKLIEELESRILSLTGDLDRHREEKFDLERRNMELEYECRTLNDGFLELKSRLEKFEHKYVDTVDSMRKDKQDTVSKYESNCEVMKKSHAEKVDEMMQKICEMDDRMLQMKQQLQVIIHCTVFCLIDKFSNLVVHSPFPNGE